MSNPPYIKTEEIESLMDEVRIHEPMMALDGDCDGLKFYKKIAKEGRQHLRSNGIIFFEIGYDQGQTVPAILEENGYKELLPLISEGKTIAFIGCHVTGKKA